jgi:hypothetical protein
MARNSIVFAIRQPGPSAEEPNQDFEEQSLRLLRHWSAELKLERLSVDTGRILGDVSPPGPPA